MSKARVLRSISAGAMALAAALCFGESLLAQQSGVISGRAITEAEFKGVNALSRDVGGKQVQEVNYRKQHDGDELQMRVTDGQDRRWILGVQMDGKATTRICMTAAGVLCRAAETKTTLLVYRETLDGAAVDAINTHLAVLKAHIVDIALERRNNISVVKLSWRREGDQGTQETRFGLDGRVAAVGGTQRIEAVVWQGTTSQDRPISFTIANGAVTSLSLDWVLPLDTLCAVAGSPIGLREVGARESMFFFPNDPGNEPLKISGRAFSLTRALSRPPASVKGILTGRFTSDTEASGTLALSSEECRASATLTWKAERQGTGTPVAAAATVLHVEAKCTIQLAVVVPRSTLDMTLFVGMYPPVSFKAPAAISESER